LPQQGALSVTLFHELGIMANMETMTGSDEVKRSIESLSPENKKVLRGIRKQILAIAPTVEERLSRGVPFFYHLEKRAFGFRAAKKHLSFFIMEGKVLETLKAEITEYDASSTVIRFTAADPLPEKLIKKLVLERISEIENATLMNKATRKNRR
jgi:uncharacterized protein YdhG (YjbR/CyaY superfamily)